MVEFALIMFNFVRNLMLWLSNFITKQMNEEKIVGKGYKWDKKTEDWENTWMWREKPFEMEEPKYRSQGKKYANGAI